MERAKNLKVNAGHIAGTDVGPVISPAAKKRIEDLIQSAADEGATVCVSVCVCVCVCVCVSVLAWCTCCSGDSALLCHGGRACVVRILPTSHAPVILLLRASFLAMRARAPRCARVLLACVARMAPVILHGAPPFL